MSVQVPNGVVDIAGRGRGRGGARSPSSTCRYFQGALPRLGARRPAAAAPRDPREPAARLRRAHGDRDAAPTRARCSSCAAHFGAGHGHRAGPHRGPADRHHRQQPDAPRRRDRPRRRRQGRALHAAVRRLRHAGAVPVRHARHHGRARGREDGAGAPLLAPVRDRRQPDRAVLHHRAAQGLRPGRAGDGRRQLPCAGIFTVAWPTGEFGGMGLEGAVKLGYRKELEAIERPRRARARCSTRWSRPPTSAARRSTPRPTSRSTT